MNNIENLNDYRATRDTVIISTVNENKDRVVVRGQAVSRINISQDLAKLIKILNTGSVGAIVIESGLSQDDLSEIHNCLELVVPHYIGTDILDGLKILAPTEFTHIATTSDLLNNMLVPDTETNTYLG